MVFLFIYLLTKLGVLSVC